MRAELLKGELSTKDILKLLRYFDTDPSDRGGGVITNTTVCHGGTSHKLYYYDNTKAFHCYTNCGTFDVIELVRKIKDCDFVSAMKWLQAFYGISGQQGSAPHKIVNPVQEVRDEVEKGNAKAKEMPSVDPSVLDHFDRLEWRSWLEEGISPQTCCKYGVKLDLLGHQIVIPHYDEKGVLVGVRSRHLDRGDVENGAKYTPLNYHGKELSYPTGQALYGLNFNREAINKYHKIVLFEAEKSVMKLDSAVGNLNISVGLNGSNLTKFQIDLLKNLDINEVIIGLDKEFKQPFTRQEKIYAQEIESTFSVLKRYFKLSVIWDTKGLLPYKNSPIDRGFSVFKRLAHDRLML